MHTKEDNANTPEPIDDRYAIRIQGRLDARWGAWFDGMNVTQDRDGTTLIQGSIADQAALHGVLQKIRDLGLELVSVTRLQSQTGG